MDAYLGQIRLFAGNYVPNGWAACDGASLPISGNEALYTLIGVTYGGDGRTTFNLPDMRSRVPIHVGQQPAAPTATPPRQAGSTYTLGQAVGVETVALVPNNYPSHNHTVNTTTAAGTSTSPQTNSLLGSYNGAGFYEPASDSSFAPLAFNAAALQAAPGGGASHENCMATIAVNYIICTVGLFPQFQ